MKRRNFIKLSSSACVMTMLPSEVFALLKTNGINACPNNTQKKIVLIQLAGANDGINTLIPLNQYDKYSNQRPSIRIKDTGLNKYIKLDTALPDEKQIGLHPVLTGFKDLYDNGMMRIIQGVGYPNSNKSHFKSSDLWLSGGDGTSANFAFETGWIGRFAESYYSNYLQSNFPIGIQLGSGDNSLGFHGAVEHGLSININNQDFSGFYSVINGLGGVPPSEVPDSEYGERLQFLIDTDASANIYGEAISNAFNSGTNTLSYPETDLSNQLKTVARFISGGLETKIYLVRIAGFDTHEGQVLSENESHLGNHATLLKHVSDGVHAFISDLDNQGKAEDVTTLTFSEFGRKAIENADLGTDHGEVAPMFAFGKGITPGISGNNVNLDEAVEENNYQIETIQHDYRSVFATILQDWLGVATPTLDLALYDFTNHKGFSDTKVTGLIKNQSLVPPTCYTTQEDPFTENPNYDVTLYPNPGYDQVTLASSNQNNIVSVDVYNIDGKLINRYNMTMFSPIFIIPVESYSAGVYLLKIQTVNGGIFNKKLLIRR